MECSRAHNRVRMWRFSDVSGPNSVPIFRACWWFGSTKPDDFSFGATKPSHPDAAVCPRYTCTQFCHRESLKTYTTYSVDKMLSIKPKDASLSLYGYTECPRRNGQNFGRVFLMLNYTDITQNTYKYIQSWTVTEIMAIEKCGLLGCPRTVRRPWRHTRPLRIPGNKTPLVNIVMQWPWRDNGTAAACVKYLET